MEAHQGQRGVAANHGVGIPQQGQQLVMEAGHGIILSHDPGGGEAKFVLAGLGDLDNLGIEVAGGIAHGGTRGENAVGKLRKGMLDLAGIGAVVERFGELGVIERLAEPGGLPEEKRHEHEEKRQRQDDKKPATLQAGFGRSGIGLHGIGFVGQQFMLAGLPEVKRGRGGMPRRSFYQCLSTCTRRR